jgi:hypothetical protein
VTRLKLRDDAFYAPTADGVCILTNSGEVVLTGPSIFQWVDRLVPYLDGRYTLAELTASMPVERKEMTERVITALRERGVLVKAEPSGQAQPPLTDAERQLYRREIGLLGYVAPFSEHSFRAFRETPLALVGSGRLLDAAVDAALCSGSRRVSIAMDLSDEDRLSTVVGRAGVVVYAGDRADLDQLHALDRACARTGIPFVAAVVTGGEAWLGPFGPSHGEHPRWASAWRRLHALDGVAATPLPAGECTGPVPTVVANQLLREVMRRLSGTSDPPGPERMTRIDLTSLRTQRHTLLPHPFVLAAPYRDRAGQHASIGRLRHGERIGADEFSRRIVACLDARLGVLGEVTERDLTQIPLAVSQVRVSDPVGLLGPDAPPPVVTGAGASLTDARRAAVLRGLAAYGSLMVDPRRLHVRPGATDPRTGDPEKDLAAMRAGGWTGFVWGHGLADGDLHEVSAEAVFPALRGDASTDLVPPGAAAGYDWDEAVRTGLLGQCRQVTLTEVADGRHRFTPIDWHEAALDEHGRRYRSLVKVIAGGLEVHDVTGSAEVPTLAFCLDGVTLAYASGFSFPEALRDGLAQLLLSQQAQTDGETGYAAARVPALPSSGRGLGVARCPDWSTDPARTVARLARLGWSPVAVPLDHDPGMTVSIMPYLVHIVLTRG